MDKKDIIVLIHDNKKVIGIKFRGKTYLVEDSNSNDIIRNISKEHEDFIDIWKNSSNNNEFKVIKGKKKIIEITNTLKNYNKNNTKARLYSAIGTVIVLGGITLGLTACNNDKNSSKENYTIVEIEEELDEKEILEILKSLDEGLQQDSWNMINEFQNYFNNVAAENYAIEEDGDSRLYLTAEQCIALFTRINADRISPEDMAYIFGPNSTYFTFANLDDKFTEACRILNYYYLYSKETSGLDKLLIDESDKKVFTDFEELVLKYNENKDEESKNEIVNSLNNIFLNPSLSDPKTTNMGATSLIGTAVVPVLHATKVVEEDLLNTLVEINETITCDKLKKYVIDSTSIESENYKNKELLEKLPSILDEYNIKNKNLDIDFEARYMKILEELYGYDYVYSTNSNKVSNSVSSSIYNNSTSITKEEAIKEFGSSNVENVENEAKEEFDNKYEDINQKEETYGKGLNAISNSSLYDKVYDFVALNGYKPSISNYSDIINSVKNSYTGSYQSSFNNGVETGASNIINNAYNDAIKEYNYRQNISSNTTITEEIIEVTPEATKVPEPTPVPTADPAPTVTQEPTYIYEETITEEYIDEEELEAELVRVRG